MSTNLLFGASPAIYQSSSGAATALQLAPVNAVGAELPAVGDAIHAVDPGVGESFKEAVFYYQETLRNKNEEGVRRERDRLVDLIHGMPWEKWSQAVKRLPAWATGGGLFATQSFKYPEVASLIGAYKWFLPAGLKTPFDMQFLRRFVAEVGEENSAKAFAHFPYPQMWFGMFESAGSLVITTCKRMKTAGRSEKELDHDKSFLQRVQESRGELWRGFASLPETLLQLAKIADLNVEKVFAALGSRMKDYKTNYSLDYFSSQDDSAKKAQDILSAIKKAEEQERQEKEMAAANEAARAAAEANPFHELNLRKKSDRELEAMVDSMGRSGPEQLFDPAMTSYYDYFAPEYFPVLEELRRRGQHGRIASLLTSDPYVSERHVWSRGNVTAYSFCRPCKRTIYEFIRKHFDEFKTDTGVLAFFALRSDENEEEKLELLAQQGAWDPLDDVRCDSGVQRSRRHQARDILDREIDRIEISKILLTIGAFGENVESRLKAVAKLEVLGRTREGSRRNLNSIATGKDVGSGWSLYRNETVIAAAKAALERLSQEGGNNG